MGEHTPGEQDLWQHTDTDLMTAAVAVSREIHRLEAHRVTLIWELEHRDCLAAAGYRSAALWLAAVTRLEIGQARRIVRLAQALWTQPEIAASYHRGEISGEHAYLIARFCEHPPKAMPDAALDQCRQLLLDTAAAPDTSTDTVRGAVAKLEHLFDSDDLPAGEDTDRNELFASTTLHGRVAVRADLDAVTGAMLLTALSAHSRPRPGPDGDRDERTPAARRADALHEILRSVLDHGLVPVEGTERPHLNVSVALKDLTGLRDLFGAKDSDSHSPAKVATDRHATETWTGPMSIAAARLLACDCHLHTITVDDTGLPMRLGRTVRTATTAQRRLLAARDHGCAFPSCHTPPAWCHAHHIVHWADGGPTDLDNMVLLCGFHHRLVHHSHWQVRIGPDRQPRFTPPPGLDALRTPARAHRRSG